MNMNPDEITNQNVSIAQNIEEVDVIHQERFNTALKNGYSEDEPDFNAPLEIETYLPV